VIRNLCHGDKVCCTVITWEGTDEDIETLDHAGVTYVIDEEGDLMLRHVEDGDMVITYGLLVQPGDRFVLTPLGWERWKSEYEDLL
jgi:hypothetical protein